jgi:hypothetical protein|eukprot:m.186729 g.186729  ORF g.186729 m.186729 type:complete len:83 (+) comp24771_c0_seq1:45-293(+)
MGCGASREPRPNGGARDGVVGRGQVLDDETPTPALSTAEAAKVVVEIEEDDSDTGSLCSRMSGRSYTIISWARAPTDVALKA